MSNKLQGFTVDYRERCFRAWYISELPCVPSEILKVISSDEYGRKPAAGTLAVWVNDDCWIDRKNKMDAEAIEIVEKNLVLEKSEMFKVQYQDAVEIAKKAKEKMMSDGFDSSNSAVNAYFKSTEEQRTLSGISDIFEKVSKMKNDDLVKEISELISKQETPDQPTD